MGVVADKAQTQCPRLERLVPKVLKNRKCLDTYELLYRQGHFSDLGFRSTATNVEGLNSFMFKRAPVGEKINGRQIRFVQL